MMQQITAPVKIAMVDDHVLLRDALASVVDTFENCQTILLASDGNEFIEKLQPENLPNLVILDLSMPVLDGYETAKWLRRNYPEIPVLVLTMYDSEMALIQLLQAGVRGFIKKDILPNELYNAIQSVMCLGYYYSQSTTGRMVNLLAREGGRRNMFNSGVLNANEIRFLKLVSTDMTYKEIAMQMNISPRTVDNYRDSLFVKLHVKSRVGLAILAIQSGMVTLSS